MIRALRSLVALLVGLALGLCVTWAAGENPWHVLVILAKSAFGTTSDFGMTLFYTTPLVFTGLSVAIAFHAGLFNIGGEGQLTIGAIAAAIVGATWARCPAFFAPTIGVLACVGGGALWGFIPGWLRARRGSHEVINTIMLNFIAAGIASYLALYPFHDPQSQNPETRQISHSFVLNPFSVFDPAPVGWPLVLALVSVVVVYLVLWRTPFGFELRALGQSEAAARASGIDVARVRILAMTIAGALAGLVGVAEVLGNAGRFKVNFSPDYGFMGIAVALLARNNPFAIIPSALLFGALHKGTADLDLETEHVTRELSLVLQGIILLSVSAEGLWTWLKPRKYTAAKLSSGEVEGTTAC
jgi:ABC-type uncharacterized transport system permease subunit